jgi:hypothetical protein
MCFKKKKVITTNPEPEPELVTEQVTEPEPTPVVITLPHPEEKEDKSITMDNYDLNIVFDTWFRDWQVPVEWRDYWRNAIEIEVTNAISSPAATWDNLSTGKRHLAVKPSYLNAGVIAHEQAHNSYALLTAEQKQEFSAAYTPLKTSDSMIKYLYSINSYGLTNDIEGHAEVYRYIGKQMPDVLKKFYPKLF